MYVFSRMFKDSCSCEIDGGSSDDAPVGPSQGFLSDDLLRTFRFIREKNCFRILEAQKE
jgi:hypothetical protein